MHSLYKYNEEACQLAFSKVCFIVAWQLFGPDIFKGILSYNKNLSYA